MRLFIKRLLAKLPTRLPIGMNEFETWSDDILETYEMPNNPSTKFALATAIMHAQNGRAYFPKAYFGGTLLKGAANQIAHAKMNILKEEQEAKAKAELEAQKQVEDTTQSSESSNDTQTA